MQHIGYSHTVHQGRSTIIRQGKHYKSWNFDLLDRSVSTLFKKQPRTIRKHQSPDRVRPATLSNDTAFSPASGTIVIESSRCKDTSGHKRSFGYGAMPFDI